MTLDGLVLPQMGEVVGVGSARTSKTVLVLVGKTVFSDGGLLGKT